MTPEDRRQAIIQATIPLLRSRGWSVTTKEIVAASGVADGTVFSVFRDKEELLLATLEAALDPREWLNSLRAIDRSLPLADRLERAVTILEEMASTMWTLTSMLQLKEVQGKLRLQIPAQSSTVDALVPLFEASVNELRIEPEAASQVLIALTLGASNPMFFHHPLTAGEVVAVMLDGVLVKDALSESSWSDGSSSQVVDR